MKSTSGCNVDNITRIIQSHVSTAVKESEISMELSYLLPFDQSEHFVALFSDIEKQSSSLGIASFGTSATTMEEVFLKWVKLRKIQSIRPQFSIELRTDFAKIVFIQSFQLHIWNTFEQLLNSVK